MVGTATDLEEAIREAAGLPESGVMIPGFDPSPKVAVNGA